jgi:hypothetical protein
METTLNIRADILEQIARAAHANKISCSEMIELLLQQVTADIADPGRIGRMVRYQVRCSSQEWRVFHVQVREDAYEYWLDLRKLLKMSVSLILAFAVKKFLCKLMKINSTDNYLCKNYIIIKDIIDSIIVWKFVWGYPPNLEKFINYKTSSF